MEDQALAMAKEHAPWRSDVPWWSVGIQGVVAVALGLYFLLAPVSAAGLVVQLVAGVLLVASVLLVLARLREAGRTDPEGYGMLQAGVGATVGLFVLLRGVLLPTLDIVAARTMLGIGLLAYAAIGVVRALRGGNIRPGPIVTALLQIVLAVVLLTSAEDNAADRLAVLGWVALVGGLILLALAWISRNRVAARSGFTRA